MQQCSTPPSGHTQCIVDRVLVGTMAGQVDGWSALPFAEGLVREDVFDDFESTAFTDNCSRCFAFRVPVQATSTTSDDL